MRTRKLGRLPGGKNGLVIWPRYHDTIGALVGWRKTVWLPTNLVRQSAYTIGEPGPYWLYQSSFYVPPPRKVSMRIGMSSASSASTSKVNKYLNCLLRRLTIDALGVYNTKSWAKNEMF